MLTSQELIEQEERRLKERGVLEKAPTPSEIDMVFTRIRSAHQHEKLRVAYVCEFEHAIWLLLRLVHCGLVDSYIRENVDDVLESMASEFLTLRADCVREVVKAIQTHKKPFPWQYTDLQQVAGWAARSGLWDEHSQIYDRMLNR
jgi:hypothetical protein